MSRAVGCVVALFLGQSTQRPGIGINMVRRTDVWRCIHVQHGMAYDL